jgi:hypothetical protein
MWMAASGVSNPSCCGSPATRAKRGGKRDVIAQRAGAFSSEKVVRCALVVQHHQQVIAAASAVLVVLRKLGF